MDALPPKVTLTPEQSRAMDIARTGFMSACPFYAHYFYSEMEEYPTEHIEVAATDGRRILYNPALFASLKPRECVFILAHEVAHVIQRHPQRGKTYRQAGKLRDLPYDPTLFNQALDFPINADLVESGVGEFPNTLGGCLDPAIKGADLAEDVYEKLYKKCKKWGGGGQGQPDGRGKSSKPGGKPGQAQGMGVGESFDDVLDPRVDPATGRVDLPNDSEFREAVARAAAAAKAMGKLPGALKRVVDEILEPQVDWREHLRMMVTGRIGGGRESWDKPNRRRLALNPIVIMPGRKGNGADTVAVAIDTSGSIGDKELSTFLAEVAGILADVRPKNVVLIWCDAAVNRVDQANTLDELLHIRAKGAPGGGGTDFRPPFDYLGKERLRVDALVYLTDLYGTFPPAKPAYPVIWAATTDQPVPWGDVVRVKVGA